MLEIDIWKYIVLEKLKNILNNILRIILRKLKGM